MRSARIISAGWLSVVLPVKLPMLLMLDLLAKLFLFALRCPAMM